MSSVYLHNRHATAVAELARRVHAAPGATDPGLRSAIHAWLAVPDDRSGSLPPSLKRYIDKFTGPATDVAEADLDALREAGLSEDEIFEITIVGALASGIRRLEIGLAALRGGR